MTYRSFDAQFLWRVEQACCNAYPAWREAHIEGWLARAAGGATRRVNSINALHPQPAAPAAILDQVAPIYARLGRPVVFRTLSLMPEIGHALDRLGFFAEGENLTLMSERQPCAPSGDVETSADPRPRWLTAWASCRPDLSEDTAHAMHHAVGSLLIPAMFFSRHEAGSVAAVAYAAIDGDIAVLEAVVTQPDHRHRGHARAIVAAARAWAFEAGAKAFCLQVGAENGPARALYGGLGFEIELYRYHYRTAPWR